MKKADVKIGGIYLTKVSGHAVAVEVIGIKEGRKGFEGNFTHVRKERDSFLVRRADNEKIIAPRDAMALKESRYKNLEHYKEVQTKGFATANANDERARFCPMHGKGNLPECPGVKCAGLPSCPQQL